MHSVVYKGRKKKTIEYYAIKSVVKSQKQRVHQEVRARGIQAATAVRTAASDSLCQL
jgi:hypothetical protein